MNLLSILLLIQSDGWKAYSEYFQPVTDVDTSDWSHEALMNTLMIMIPIIIIIALIMIISFKKTGGRTFLYKSIQDNGYDSANTIDALIYVVNRILSNEGFEHTNLSIGHEVGNRFEGEFYCKKDGFRHVITVITDGNIVDYKIDLGPTKRYKK